MQTLPLQLKGDFVLRKFRGGPVKRTSLYVGVGQSSINHFIRGLTRLRKRRTTGLTWGMGTLYLSGTVMVGMGGRDTASCRLTRPLTDRLITCSQN